MELVYLIFIFFCDHATLLLSCSICCGQGWNYMRWSWVEIIRFVCANFLVSRFLPIVDFVIFYNIINCEAITSISIQVNNASQKSHKTQHGQHTSLTTVQDNNIIRLIIVKLKQYSIPNIEISIDASHQVEYRKNKANGCRSIMWCVG